MNEKGLVTFAALILLTTTVPAATRGDVRRDTPARRPYIVEIGEPYSITMQMLEREARNDTELSEYLSNYGYPDYAEIQEVAPDWPWEDHEVRVYYLRSNLELDFGHVILSEAIPNLGVRRFLGHIPLAKRHEIEVILAARAAPPAAPPVAEPPPSGAAVPPAPPVVAAEPAGGSMEALVARIEAAADRAAQAADRAAEQSEAAVRAADRTVSIVEMMEQSAPPQEPKRPKRATHH